MDNLEDVLNGQAPEDTAALETPADPPEQTAEAAPSQPRDEHGRFVPKGETEQPAKEPEQAAPPAAETEPQGNVPTKALIEERRKRQAETDRAERAERELAQYRQQPQPQYQPEPQYQPHAQVGSNVPVVFDDEYAQTIFEQAVSYVRQEMAPQIHSTRMDLVREMVRAQHPDYDQVENEFRGLIQDNPALMAEVMRQPNPVEYAYQLTKKHLTFKELGATDISSLEQQIRAKVLAEMQATPAQTPAAPQTIPTSLADAQSARASTVPTAPPSLNDILGRR